MRQKPYESFSFETAAWRIRPRPLAADACSSSDRSGVVARYWRSGVKTRPTLIAVNRSKGMLLLGLWVILSNLLPMLSLRIPNANLLLAVLGVVAGVLLLVDR